MRPHAFGEMRVGAAHADRHGTKAPIEAKRRSHSAVSVELVKAIQSFNTGHELPAMMETTMKLRGRVMKLELVSEKVEPRIATNADGVVWTRRFRAADPANEQVYQDILAYFRAHYPNNFDKGGTDERHASQCFRTIFFPIRQAVCDDLDPYCAGFAQTPDLLRRLVTALWKYQRACREPFPLDYHWVDLLAGSDGKDMCKLWCLYADLADLWVADRRHPQILALRQYRAEAGMDQ